jgi:peptidoglycan L-alanyl-D-glutamate endopeptidase CwlK
MNLALLITEVQRKVGAEPDGAAGPETWNAIYKAFFGHGYLPQPSATPPAPGEPPSYTANDAVDARSEGVIATLLPQLHPVARALVHAAAEIGITIKVISGLRTYEEQNALYNQGRTKPGRIVTNASAGHSNHNFGIAFDIGVFQNGNYLDESPAYKAVAALGKNLGLTWGGDWVSIQDEPHYELRPKWASAMNEGAMLAELRERKAAGQEVFA